MIALLAAVLLQAPEIVALPANNHPTVSIALQFKSGTIDDPAGKAGVTMLAANLMAQGGTETLDAKTLMQKLFPMATGVSVIVDKQLTTFQTTVHVDHLEAMVKILTDVVAHPRWDEKEFNRIRTDAVNDVQKRLRENDDENLGKQALEELIYRGTAFGRADDGHVSDLQSLTLADVKAQAASVFTLDRLVIGLAGHYDKGLAAQLQKALAKLPKKGAAQVVFAACAKDCPAEPRFELIDKKTASSAVSIGMRWMSKEGQLNHKSGDWAAMSIARSAFGEHRQFNGRLMQRLREARGLNYGDYSYLENYVQEGGDAATSLLGRARSDQMFSIWLRPVQNENRLFALRAALYELQRTLKDEPFSSDEVERTKGFLTGYILLFAQTDARRLGYALDDRFLGDKDFLDRWHSQVASVTTEQVNAAWQRWQHPEALHIVMVTPDAAALKKDILAGTPSPMHYQKDAQGHTADKPKALLATDTTIAALPLGAKADADVEVTSSSQIFQ